MTERRIIRLEERFRRAGMGREASPTAPTDWRTVPDALLACFAALTPAECAEWGELMAASHDPGAWHRLKDDRAFFRRLAELDGRVDWHAGMAPAWMVR